MLDAVEPERRVVLVGHSLGAIAILAMAQERPDLFGDRVAGVVLTGSAMSDLWRGAMGSLTELLRPRLGSLHEAASRVNRLRRYVLSSPPDVGHVVARTKQFGPDAAPHVIDHVVALAARAPSKIWTDALATLMDVDVRPAVAHVDVPALVIAGEHDRMTPPASAVALAGELPDGRLELLERAGHFAMLEVPDAFNERLERFADGVLARTSGAGRSSSAARSARRKRPA